MKICFVTSEMPMPPRSGVARKTYELISALSKSADVDVFSFHPTNSPLDSVSLQRDEEMGDRVVVVPLRSGRLPQQRYRASLMREAIDSFGRAQYDVVHLDTLMLGHLRSLFPSSSVAVWSLNDSRSHAIAEESRLSDSYVVRAGLFARYAVARRIETRLGPSFDFVDVVSENEAIYLRRLGLDNVRVLPLGMPNWRTPSTQSVTRRDGGGRLRVGIMSWLGEMYGHAVERFIRDAWPLVTSVVDAELLVVGRLEQADPSLRALLVSDATISHIDYMASRRTYLKSIDISVVPLALPTGLPTKALESLAAGVPVVGMQQLNNLPESWAGRAFGVAETFPALGRLLASILSDPETLDSMHENVLEMASEWPSWESIASRYLSDAREHLRDPT